LKVLNIRGIDEEVARQFAGGAAVRGWTQAEYLKQLLWLHSFVRLDHRSDQWQWDGPEDGDQAYSDAATWSLSETTPAYFIDELGKYLSRQRMLAVTA
jgi:hypothetical protein